MPTPSTIGWTRHFHRLSEHETDALVEAVADLIVHVLMGRRDPARAGDNGPERHHERDREHPNPRWAAGGSRDETASIAGRTPARGERTSA